MIEIIEKICGGDFSLRLKTKGLQNDELGTFATSFNLLVGKMDELIVHAVDQVEKKYESQPLQTVQRQFLPALPLNLKKFCFAGQSLFSSSYGGDWWYYEQIRDSVVLFIGKGEARGLPAAMLTSVIRGTISSICANLRATSFESPHLKNFLVQMNSVLFSLAQGAWKMSGVIALVNIRTGVMEIVNAGHGPPFLCRADSDSKEVQIKPLQLKKSNALGASHNFKFEIEAVQIEPGDILFLYTRGLFQTQNAAGEALTAEKILAMLSDLKDQGDGQAMKMSIAMLEQLKVFFGGAVENLKEDITLAIATVPQQAEFEESEEPV